MNAIPSADAQTAAGTVATAGASGHAGTLGPTGALGPTAAGHASLASRLRASASASANRKAWPLFAVLTGFWLYVTLSDLLYAANMQASISSMSPGHYFAEWDARLIQHAVLYPALLLCVWASMRIGWQRPWRTIPAQLAIALVFSILASPALSLGDHLTVTPGTAFHMGQDDEDFFSAPNREMWLASATSFFLAYGFAVALTNGFALYRRFRDAQMRSAALERALAAAHLAALRMQLSPHTLFNLLHTIRGQIAWDPASAQAMVVQLGDLLRQLLNAGEREHSRLADELEFVRLYLELQQQRFADRLTVWIAAVADLPQSWVPSLILQPLVENAVVHGLAGHTGAVVIRVEASAEGGTLLLRVINTVVGDAPVGRDSIGIRNVRERLAVQFGERARFQSCEAQPGIWIAEIQMPVLQEPVEPGRMPADLAARV